MGISKLNLKSTLPSLEKQEYHEQRLEHPCRLYQEMVYEDQHNDVLLLDLQWSSGLADLQPFLQRLAKLPSPKTAY